jgi:hypothetical protein
MARAHTAGEEKHGNMATCLLSFLLSVQEFLRRKKRNSYSRNFAHNSDLGSNKQAATSLSAVRWWLVAAGLVASLAFLFVLDV